MSTEAEQLSQDGQTEQTDSTKDQYLTFTTDGEDYGIEIAHIKEIIKIDQVNITRVPQTQAYVKGIINLRGDIIPVVDVRARFLKPEKEYDSLTCIIVVDYNGYVLGFLVDQVQEVMYIYDENIVPPPSAKLNHFNQYIRNIGKVGDSVKLLLDLDKFLAIE